ncbi:MAG TPA: ribonuclease H-like domain-containing protein [Mobilitalea sp.]|nr:ribonuclease H-like domain-containing protein [Mobilitalea sp.]
MITRYEIINQKPDYPLDKDYDLSRIVFFDIETTGFAADASYLYLIGCAYYDGSAFQLVQWFSEGINEEARLITSFFEFLKDYDYLFHYNGTGFDIPFLQRKIDMLKLDYSFDRIASIDLYKKITPYKKILKLNNYKLKSLEAFLHIHREDIFDGGDLIQVYQSYLGKKNYETLRKMRDPEAILPSPSESDQLLYQLLLHNADDIKGLISICPILYYVDLFEKPFRILQAWVEDQLLYIRFEKSGRLPSRIQPGNDLVHLTAYENTALLTVHVYEGELKYFYDNYKDYYYLPAEDYAIHKSVAGFVEKEYRTKAKPSNCYTRKQGIFAPQFETLIKPYFKMNYPDKLSFLEVHTDFLLQEEILEQYVSHLLAHLVVT